jgi:hypothetical protein
LVIAPCLAPGIGLGHYRAPAGEAHLRVKLARFLRRQPLTFDPPGGDQEMRVPVRAFSLVRSFMWRVHVELHRDTLGHEVLECERAGQRDTILEAQFGIRRQCENDLAGELRVLRFLSDVRVFHSTALAANFVAAPSGSSTSWCAGGSRCLK